MRRPIAAIVCACLALGAPTAVLAAKQSWAHREIKVVTDRGLMGGNAAAFRPDAPLTQRALADLVAELTELPPPEPAAPAAQATLAGWTRHSFVDWASPTTRAGSTSEPARPASSLRRTSAARSLRG